MKKTRQEKGITLIALIITIVVLLILAVVAIRAVQGDGIIQYAKNARNDYEQAQENEQGMLDSYISKIEGSLGGGNGSSSISSTTEEGVPIPAGFKYVTGTKSTGVVIENETEGSQFVWVPVTTDIVAYSTEKDGYEVREPDVVTGVEPSEIVDSASGTKYDAVEANLTTAGCTQDLNGDNVVNAYDFKIQLTNEFNSMAASVKKYGGYYVGRYEVSINAEGKAQSKGSSTGGTEIKSATAEKTSGNGWYGLYALCKTYNTSSVASSMIWNTQYDAMITWLKDTGEFNPSGYNSELSNNGYTGSNEEDKVNNVYDLYGWYMIEWTMGANHGSSWSGRIYRYGGEGLSSDLVPYPSAMGAASGAIDVGSRLALYIL